MATPTVSHFAIVPNGSYAINVSPDLYVCSVKITAAGTAEDITVPTGAKYVVFGATGNFCVAYNATAGDKNASFADVAADGTGCEVNPTIRYLKNVAEISIDATANDVTVSCTFFK